jgi:hypothetical protein
MHGLTTEISEGGFGVTIGALLELGHRVFVTPIGYNAMLAVVRWIRGRAYGFEFLELSLEHQVSVSLAMTQDSIGVVATGRRKLQGWKTTQKQNLAKSRGHSYSGVGWISRQNFLALRSRENFFLDILFIELMDRRPKRVIAWFQQLTRDKIIAESLYQVYRFLFLRFHRFDLTTMIPLLASKRCLGVSL